MIPEVRGDRHCCLSSYAATGVEALRLTLCLPARNAFKRLNGSGV